MTFTLDNVRNPKSKSTARGETAFHINLVRDLRRILAPGTVFFHVPNGGRRTAAEGGVLSAMGMMAGVPDLLFVRDGTVVGLELKIEGGELSIEQRQAHVTLRGAGMRIEVARSLDEAIELLREMNIPLRIKDQTANEVFRPRRAA